MPLTLEELYAQAPAALAGLLGATSHVQRVIDGGELAAYLPAVHGFFSPRTQEVILHPEVSAHLSKFLVPPAKTKKIEQEAIERWELAMVKTHVATLVAKTAHGLGPPDAALMQAEWDAYWRHPHIHTITSGIAELVAELYVDRFIVATELSLIDPRLLEVQPLRTRFVAQTTMLRIVLTEVAHDLGTTLDDEVARVVRDGASQLAVWRLVQRWGQAPIHRERAILRRPGSLIDLRRTVEQGLVGVAKDWSDAA